MRTNLPEEASLHKYQFRHTNGALRGSHPYGFVGTARELSKRNHIGGQYANELTDVVRKNKHRFAVMTSASCSRVVVFHASQWFCY